MRICPECEKKSNERTCAECRTATVPLSSVTAPSDPLIGSRIGNYEIQGVIGRGGMGVVYRGLQLSMDRPVAIKVISPSLAKDLQVVKRFQREAKLTSKLQHPNSIRVYDFGLTEDGVPYLVMELLEGRELVAEMRTTRQLPLDRAVMLVTQVLKALNEAHGLGIVHRDLKPANIFLSRMGEDELVKVMDFGIAKVIRGETDSSNQNLTQAGLLVGTPQYMSPEQIKGTAIDHRSDLYSLGCIFFQMLSGHVPFTAENPIAVMMMHTADTPPPIANFRPDLANHAGLQDALDRLLAKAPADRPVSAMHAINLLQRVAPASVENTGGVEVMALDTAGFRRLETSRQQSVPNPMTPMPSGGIPAGHVPPTAELPRGIPAAAATRQAPPSTGPGTDPQLKAAGLPAAPAISHQEETEDGSGPEDEETDTGARPARARVPLVMAVAGSLGMAAAGITFFAVGRTPPVPLPVVEPQVAAAPPPAGEPKAEKVILKLRSTPPGATAFVENEPVGVTPLDHEVPRGSRALTVRMELAGYVHATSETVPSQGQTMALELTRAQADAPAGKAGARKKAAGKGKVTTKNKASDADLLEDL